MGRGASSSAFIARANRPPERKRLLPGVVELFRRDLGLGAFGPFAPFEHRMRELHVFTGEVAGKIGEMPLLFVDVVEIVLPTRKCTAL
jgi:hypothetical protein